MQVLYETHTVARETLQQKQMSQKRTYDLKVSRRAYERGDLVYLIDSASKVGQSKKLQAIYKGPYLVIEVINSILYRIQRRKQEVVVHHDRIKPCRDSIFPLWLCRRRHELLQLDETIAYDSAEQEEEDSQVADVRPQVVVARSQATNVRPQTIDTSPQATDVQPQATYVRPWVNLSNKEVPSGSLHKKGKNNASVIHTSSSQEMEDVLLTGSDVGEDEEGPSSVPKESRGGRRIRPPAHLKDFNMD